MRKLTLPKTLVAIAILLPATGLAADQVHHSIAASSTEARIEPFGRKKIDPSKEPLVLVHGYGPANLVFQLAQRLSGENYQVFIAYHDFKSTQAHESGMQIARELSVLRERHYPQGQSLTLIAHSMGGIIARCALNYLADPSWLGDPSDDVSWTKNGGFGKTRLRTMDTAIDGYSFENETPALIKIMRKKAERGIDDAMQATSPMFERLYSVKLDHVDFQNTVAFNNAGKEDWVRSLPELRPELARQVVLGLRDGTDPEDPQLRNLTRGLRADSRFEVLRGDLITTEEEGRLDLDVDPDAAFMPELTRIFDSAMPRVEGKHILLPLNQPHRKDDMGDHVIEELRRTRQELSHSL